MTIAIAGNFTEGVVFAVDSAVTYCFRGQVQKIYNSAQKLFHVGKCRDWSDSPYGAMLFGGTHYGNRSWRNILADFCRSMGNPHTEPFDEFIRRFMSHLETLCPEEGKRPDGGMFLAGYGNADADVHCAKINVKTLKKEDLPIGTVSFDGVPDVVQFLLFGCTENTKKALRTTFENATVKIEGAGEKPLVDFVLEVVALNSPRCLPDMDMPLRDAIDYMHHLVYSTVKYFKFASGAPLCGGPIEIAVVTRDRGFRRILTKPLDSAI